MGLSYEGYMLEAYLLIPAPGLLQLGRPRRRQGRHEEPGGGGESHDGPVINGDVELDVEQRVHTFHSHLVQLERHKRGDDETCRTKSFTEESGTLHTAQWIAFLLPSQRPRVQFQVFPNFFQTQF